MLMVLPVLAHVALMDTTDDYALENTNVTLEVTGEPLVKVFDEIERQTRFLFLTPADKVKSYARVDLARGTYTVKEALDYVLKKTPLRYRQKNNYIVIFQTAEGRNRRRASTNDMALVTAEAPELSTHESLTGEDVKKLVLGFLYMPVKTFQSLQKAC
jgi:hypothetical protein